MVLYRIAILTFTINKVQLNRIAINANYNKSIVLQCGQLSNFSIPSPDFD